MAQKLPAWAGGEEGGLPERHFISLDQGGEGNAGELLHFIADGSRDGSAQWDRKRAAHHLLQ